MSNFEVDAATLYAFGKIAYAIHNEKPEIRLPNYNWLVRIDADNKMPNLAASFYGFRKTPTRSSDNESKEWFKDLSEFVTAYGTAKKQLLNENDYMSSGLYELFVRVKTKYDVTSDFIPSTFVEFKNSVLVTKEIPNKIALLKGEHPNSTYVDYVNNFLKGIEPPPKPVASASSKVTEVAADNTTKIQKILSENARLTSELDAVNAVLKNVTNNHNTALANNQKLLSQIEAQEQESSKLRDSIKEYKKVNDALTERINKQNADLKTVSDSAYVWKETHEKATTKHAEEIDKLKRTIAGAASTKVEVGGNEMTILTKPVYFVMKIDDKLNADYRSVPVTVYESAAPSTVLPTAKLDTPPPSDAKQAENLARDAAAQEESKKKMEENAKKFPGLRAEEEESLQPLPPAKRSPDKFVPVSLMTPNEVYTFYNQFGMEIVEKKDKTKGYALVNKIATVYSFPGDPTKLDKNNSVNFIKFLNGEESESLLFKKLQETDASEFKWINDKNKLYLVDGYKTVFSFAPNDKQLFLIAHSENARHWFVIPFS